MFVSVFFSSVAAQAACKTNYFYAIGAETECTCGKAAVGDYHFYCEDDVATQITAENICPHGELGGCLGGKFCIPMYEVADDDNSFGPADMGDDSYTDKVCDASEREILDYDELCFPDTVCVGWAYECQYWKSGQENSDECDSDIQYCSLTTGCTDIGECDTGIYTPKGYICSCSGRTNYVELGFCDDKEGFTEVAAENLCKHGEIASCDKSKYCVAAASTVETANTPLTAQIGNGAGACNAATGVLILSSELCELGDICNGTAVWCLWMDGTTEMSKKCLTTEKCQDTGCIVVPACDVASDVATPTGYECMCNSAYSGGNGFCDHGVSFTTFSATNVCDHGATCAADNFCVKSTFAVAGTTTGTAAKGAADKFCDATTGTVIDKSTVCEDTKTCTSTAKQCLWSDDTTKKNTECDVGQTCEYKGCEDSESDIDTSAIALSGLTGFLLTLVNVV